VCEQQVKNLKVGVMIIYIDFSMNIAHKGWNTMYAEWWSHAQSTLLPIIVQLRREENLPVETHQHFFVSGDLEHDAAFVDHCLEMVIELMQSHLML